MVTGVDDRHLDVRLVLQLRRTAEGHELVAVTVLRRHDALGRACSSVARPFHARVVPAVLWRLVDRAVPAAA